MLGAAGLIFINNGDISIRNTIFALLPLLGSACYALNVNLIKNFLQDMSTAKITGISFLFIGPIAGFIFFYTNFLIIWLTTKTLMTSFNKFSIYKHFRNCWHWLSCLGI